MADPIRVPLLESIEPRLATSDKDAVSTNIFYDKAQNGVVYANKRPGLGANISGSGLASGVYGWKDFLFDYNDPTCSWPCVVWNGSIFCSIMRKDDATTGYPDVSIISSDGINWNMGVLPAEGLWNHIAWNGTVFCAVGYNATLSTYLIATSTDGLTWTQRTSPSSSQWQGVAANTTTGRLVIVSSTGTSGYSTDNGATWSVGGTFGGGVGAPFGQPITWNAGAGVFATLGGASSNTIYTSTDGVAWSSQVSDSVAKRCIISNSTTFVVLPYSAGSTTGYTSTNGTTWNSMTVSSASFWWRGTWTGSLFVAVGTSGTLMYSSNGTSWTTTSNNFVTDPSFTIFNYPYSIAGNDDIIVTLVYGETAFQRFMTSPADSTDYSQRNLKLNYPYPAGIS